MGSGLSSTSRKISAKALVDTLADLQAHVLQLSDDQGNISTSDLVSLVPADFLPPLVNPADELAAFDERRGDDDQQQLISEAGSAPLEQEIRNSDSPAGNDHLANDTG